MSKPGTEPSLQLIDEGNAARFMITPKGTTEEFPHYLRLWKGEETHLCYIQLDGRKARCCYCNTDRHTPKQCVNLYCRIVDGIQLREGVYKAVEPCDERDREEMRGEIQQKGIRHFLNWDDKWLFHPDEEEDECGKQQETNMAREEREEEDEEGRRSRKRPRKDGGSRGEETPDVILQQTPVTEEREPRAPVAEENRQNKGKDGEEKEGKSTEKEVKQAAEREIGNTERGAEMEEIPPNSVAEESETEKRTEDRTNVEEAMSEENDLIIDEMQSETEESGTGSLSQSNTNILSDHENTTDEDSDCTVTGIGVEAQAPQTNPKPKPSREKRKKKTPECNPRTPSPPLPPLPSWKF
ncbi:myb-like protein X [Physella acuta]|uniref:myb-like protein X n=1 Tax=Physella acuta TaxID=109671 RepID=UPI0027DC41EE|nr:myb-like protein X [Physella acuta]